MKKGIFIFALITMSAILMIFAVGDMRQPSIACAGIHPTEDSILTTWQDDGFVADSFGGGAGTYYDPYLINNAGELAWLARQVNGGGFVASGPQIDLSIWTNFEGTHFLVTNDIDLRGRDWVVIGGWHNTFRGHFNGGGHEIILPQTIRQEFGFGLGTDSYVAFGFLGRIVNGSIRDLSLRGDVIEWTSTHNSVLNHRRKNVGAVVASATNTTIENVHMVGHLSNIVAPRSEIVVGGLIGRLRHSTLTNASNHARINVIATEQAFAYIGGIVGGATDSVLNNVVNRGNISEVIAGSQLYIGGIVGLTMNNWSRSGATLTVWNGGVEIINFANYGNITANLILTGWEPPRDLQVGGIIGRATGNLSWRHPREFHSVIANGYNRGDVTVNGLATHTNFVGGIVGWAQGTTSVPVVNNEGVQVDTIIMDNVSVLNVYNSGILQGETTGQIVASTNNTRIENAFGLPLSANDELLNNLNNYRNDVYPYIYALTTSWAIGYGGHPQLKGLSYVPQPPPIQQYFTITFLDMNGDVLEIKRIAEGTTITPIEAPSIPLYLFLYWRTVSGDDLFTALTQNTVFLAIYNRSDAHFVVTITFHGFDGAVLAQITATLGFLGVDDVPTPPQIEGFEFTRWFNTQGFVVDRQIPMDTSFWAIYELTNAEDNDDVERTGGFLNLTTEDWIMVGSGLGFLFIVILVAVLIVDAVKNLTGNSKSKKKKKRKK
ncbi:MAG: hypothetical protein FWE16_05640 [Firmicutes bacterium]|nr:hypothetical protein [Bacillota bacterium]